MTIKKLLKTHSAKLIFIITIFILITMPGILSEGGDFLADKDFMYFVGAFICYILMSLPISLTWHLKTDGKGLMKDTIISKRFGASWLDFVVTGFATGITTGIISVVSILTLVNIFDSISTRSDEWTGGQSTFISIFIFLLYFTGIFLYSLFLYKKIGNFIGYKSLDLQVKKVDDSELKLQDYILRVLTKTTFSFISIPLYFLTFFVVIKSKGSKDIFDKILKTKVIKLKK